MAWAFTVVDVATKDRHVESHAEWYQALAALVTFIDLARPKAIRSLHTVCENIPIEKSASFSCGQYYFSLSPENG